MDVLLSQRLEQLGFLFFSGSALFCFHFSFSLMAQTSKALTSLHLQKGLNTRGEMSVMPGGE